MPLGVKHFTEPTTKSERAAMKAEQAEWRALGRRVEDLEVVLRAALSFVQGRHNDPNDGHAVMVIAAMRGALRKDRD